jgi:threonine-phosphate decarboxylase
MTHNLDKTHGGRVAEAAEQLKLKISDIIDFSANINPQGLPPGLKSFIANSIGSIVHYPEIRAETLRDQLAARAKLPEWSILPAAGSTPLIYMLARYLGTQNNAIICPAFSEYENALTVAGLRQIHLHVLEPADGFELTESKLDSILSQKHDMLILANPANPTGRLVQPKLLQKLVNASSEQGFWLVIDEAFIDFCLYKNSIEPQILEHTSLIVLKSLTKLFAIPGLRLGYLACGNRFFMNNLANSLEPWSINSLAQKAGVFLLGKSAYIAKTPLVTAAMSMYLHSVLSPYFDFLPSDCNFFMARLKDFRNPLKSDLQFIDPQIAPKTGQPPIAPKPGQPRTFDPEYNRKNKSRLISFLFNKGILIRDLDGMAGLPDGFIRLAVRPTTEIDLLKAALNEYLELPPL